MMRQDHFGVRDGMAAITAVRVTALRFRSGERFDLREAVGQGVPVVRIARQCAHSDHEVTLVGDCHADLDAEFVFLRHFALGQTFHFRDVHGIQLVFAVALLR